MESSTISYSTLSRAGAISEIRREYALGEVTNCDFLHRGLNDTFRVQTTDGWYAFRVYRAGWRSPSEIQFELDVLQHCDRNGVSVSVPVRRRDGSYISSVEQPEGPRHAVVFTYAHGEQPGEHSDVQVRYFGRESAHLHQVCDDFSSVHPRFAMDLFHLVDQPLNLTLPFLAHRPDDQQYLMELAARIRSKVEAVRGELNFGFCHGDLHGGNVAFDGEKVTMFDFDCCGMGWRSYDIAVYRWLLEIRNWGQKWLPFIDSYQELAALGPVDLDTVPWFVAARYVWLLGLHALNAGFFGLSFMNDQLYWNFWLKLIRDWDAKELKS